MDSAALDQPVGAPGMKMRCVVPTSVAVLQAAATATMSAEAVTHAASVTQSSACACVAPYH